MDEGHFELAGEVSDSLLETRHDASALLQPSDQTFNYISATI
jgi:hypothetical protein